MRIFRAYIISVRICACAVTVAAGAFTADGNVKRISLGKTEAEVAVFYNEGRAVIGTDEIRIKIGTDEYEKIKSVLSVTPPPVCNIFWLYQGMVDALMGNTSTR